MITKSRKIRFLAGLLAFILVFMNCNTEEVFAAGKSNNSGNSVTVQEKKSRSNQKTDIIVKYKNQSKRSTTIKEVKAETRSKKLDQKRYFKNQGIGIYEISKTDDLETVIQELNNDPNVEYAQPNYPLETAATPTDDKLDKQWYIYNDAQKVNGYTGRRYVDINVMSAWDQPVVSENVVIGILDTGIQIQHNDLKDNIYVNPQEIAGNGVDDDGNGYVDDVNGWDFSNDDASVYDSAATDSHGTYVAGIIAAEENNGGMVGVAPNVKILPLKFISGSIGYTSDAIEAIEYAMNMGVKVVNCSFGGTDNNQALMDAMSDSGILFICAAGNKGASTGESPVYPAAFDIDNVLSVTSIDSTGVLPSFASYGLSVDVAAPGTSILSTVPGDKYDYFSGTSVSAAIVSGIAALVESRLPNESISAIKNRIITGVTKCTSLNGATASGGRVDAYAALTGTVQLNDPYTGVSITDDILPVEGGGEADTWYIMNELASNAERLHYGEGGVNPASGNYSVTCTDMSVTTPGFTVQISRTYNSRNLKQTLLGRGWTFGFEGKITDKTDSIEISLPNGSCHVFNLIDGAYVGEGTRASFTKNAGGVDILTTTDQYKYGFSTSTNKLIYMEDKNGNQIWLTYTDEKLVKITDTVGRDYTLAYNENSLLTSVTDPAGRKVTYEYNSSNLLSKVTDPEGGSLTYDYDSSQYLIKQRDQKDILFQEIGYDHNFGVSENKVISSKDAAGESWSYSYDTVENNATITNNENKKWTYWFNIFMDTIKIQYPDGKYTSTVYDYPNYPTDKTYYGDILATTDRDGNRTEYVVDKATGNTTKVTNPDGSFKSYIYDKWNNVIEEVNEIGSRTYYIYDSIGANLLKKVRPLNGTDNYIEGNTTLFAVDSNIYYTEKEAETLFNCSVAGLLKSKTDPEGNTTTYTYDKYGNIASITDAAGNKNTYSYDSIGQKLNETTANGNITKWDYNDNGQILRVINPDGGVKRNVYDVAGNLVLEVSPNLYDSKLDNKTTNAYTGTKATKYAYKDNGYLDSVTDAEGNKTTYTYDIYGNRETETKPNNSIYHYEYDTMNRLVKTSFQENATAGKVILSEISYSTLANGNSQTTTKEYASDDKVTTIVMVKDYAGREVSVQYGDYSRTKTVYKQDGTIQQTTAANGAITYYSYDALGNMTQVWKPMAVINGESKYSWTRYTYDKAGHVITEETGKDLVAKDATTANTYIKSYTYEQGLLKETTDSDGRKDSYTYDGEGNIQSTTQSITTGVSQVTEYAYNYLGKLSSITKKVRAGDLSGNSYTDGTSMDIITTYSYDLNGNLISETDAAGTVTSYTYDSLNRALTTSKQLKNSDGTLASNVTTSKTYIWDGQLASETDANGNVTSYTYDVRGNQTRITDALGKITLKYYDRMGNNTAIVSPKNYNYEAEAALSEMEHTEFTYDNLGRVLTQTEVYLKQTLDSSYQWKGTWVTVTSKTYEYDTLGNVIRTKDALGNTTESSYNLAGLLELVTDAATKQAGLPYTVKYTYNGLEQKTEEAYPGATYSYTYNGTGNLLSTKVNGVTKLTATYDHLGRKINSTDGNGNTTTMTWNAFGKLSQMITPGDETIPSNQTIYQYDKIGNLVYTKDSVGKITTYAYDSLGRSLSQTIGNGTTTNVITRYNEYDPNGNIKNQIDGNGNTTTYTYDKLNRVEKVKNTLEQTTSYAYDENGNQTTQKDYLGNTTTKVYDGINRLIEVKDALGNTIQQLLYNDADVQTHSYDALHHVTQYLYDANLRQKATIEEDCTTETTYDSRGNITTKKDGNGNITTYEYDDENRLISVTDDLGNHTLYSYDLAGNLISQTDGNGNTTTYQYNAANLLKAKSGAAGTGATGTGKTSKSETYTYDANGLMATKTDRNGIVTVYSYDIFGRKLSEDADGEIQTYTYDANGNLLTITDPSGTTQRTYDGLNRTISKTVPDIGKSTYVYDIASVSGDGTYSERITDPKGNVTLKTYDQVGRLSSVTVGEETTVYEYLPNGTRSKVTYPDGTTETYTYNKNNQVTKLTNAKANGMVISYFDYTYDCAGNQLTKKELKGTTTYTYDSLNRLSSVTEPEGKVTSYTYDGAGNRRTEEVQYGLVAGKIVYTYDSQNRLVSTVSLGGAFARYQYDNNGNLISKINGTMEEIADNSTLTAEDLPQFDLIIKRGSDTGTKSGNITTYTYDNYNRLISYQAEKTGASYTYNAQGYRVEKTANGVTTKYLYEADKVVLETDENNTQTAFQAYGTNHLYRSVEADAATSTEEQSYYYLYNAHGDVTELIDDTGAIAVKYDYDAFGNLLSETGNADNATTYTGYQYDKESGLYYLNARYYDSVTARFITEDIYIGKQNDPLSLNLYSYCSNNPIVYSDPSGHAPTSVHSKDTYTITYEKFCDYIDVESEKIVVYKKKKGKDTKVIDTKATEKKRTDWIDEQKEKAGDYAKAFAAGDKYVDSESKILHNTKDIKSEGDYDYKYFHAFNVQGDIKRSNTVTQLINQSKLATDYLMTGKGKKPSLSLSLDHAKYTITTDAVVKKETVTTTKKDKNGNEIIDKKTNKPVTETKTVTTTVSLPSNTYKTDTGKALFVSGMGLHTLQDSYYHVTEKHTNYSDNNDYDYVNGGWTDDYVDDFTIAGINFTGGNRYKETLTATSNWVDDLLSDYGSQMFGYNSGKKSKK